MVEMKRPTQPLGWRVKGWRSAQGEIGGCSWYRAKPAHVGHWCTAS